MNKHFTISLFLILVSIYGCSTIKEETYFNGVVKVVNPDIKVKILSHNDIVVDYPLWGAYVHDSLIITMSGNKDFNFSIINLNTGKNIGDFCHRGRANNEILATTNLSHVFIEDNELKSIIIDPNENRLYKWNISQSIHTKTTIFDTITSFRSLSKYKRPYDYAEYINDTTLITYTQSHLPNQYETKPELPFIEFRSLNKDSLYKKIYVFKNVFEDAKPMANLNDDEYNQFTPSYRFYSSRTAISPNHLFIVQSMLYIGRLNIINITTGEITGIQLEHTPDFSIFKKGNKMKEFYFRGGLWTTNERIYVGYSGKMETSKGNTRYMYEFDWSGNIINIYDIGKNVDEILYDKVNSLFYCVNYSEEKLSSFDLNKN